MSISHAVFWSPLSHTAMGLGLGARPYQAIQISQRLCRVCHLEWGVLPCCRLSEYSCFSLKHIYHIESRQLPCFICGGQSSFHWGTKRVCKGESPGDTFWLWDQCPPLRSSSFLCVKHCSIWRLTASCFPLHSQYWDALGRKKEEKMKKQN